MYQYTSNLLFCELRIKNKGSLIINHYNLRQNIINMLVNLSYFKIATFTYTQNDHYKTSLVLVFL